MSASIKSVASVGLHERFMVYANHADGNRWCVRWLVVVVIVVI
jgi:hypothetical protein